jgi:Tol biopolymer transport system component
VVSSNGNALCRGLPLNTVPCSQGAPGLESGHFTRDGSNDWEIAVRETSDTPESVKSTPDRLDSWKEIAVYLNRDITTAQRWEKREGMPVHRHRHDRSGSVYAFRTELDAWGRSRNLENLEAVAGNGNSIATPVPPAPEHRTRALELNWRWVVPLAAVAALVVGAGLWFESKDYFWRNPIAGAKFQRLTDWDGAAQAAALSRDGQFVAFISDRDKQMDVWITQVGSGQFHNLTHGSAAELINPAIRPLGFSANGSLVTFWVRKPDESGGAKISIWAVPTLGGEPRPYLEGAAELDWSPDGSRVAYHTTDPGDPLFVSDGTRTPQVRPIFAGPAGLHTHFPLWAPDSAFLYFAHGAAPDKLDLWRIRPEGGTPEQITSQAGVSYPVLLNRRTLLYLSADADGLGSWLYCMDTAHRVPHRLTFGPDRYASLSSNADGRRLALTLVNPKTTLWQMPLPDSQDHAPEPDRIVLTTGAGHSPRLGPGYLLYVSSSGASESIWKIADGASEELWDGPGAQIIGAPAISADGSRIAFSTLQDGKKRLYVMRPDGSSARTVADSLDLQGSPAWTSDGQSITSAANDRGVPHLYRVPAGGGSPIMLLQKPSLDPAWPTGDGFVLYSSPDVGTTFSVNRATPDGAQLSMPALTLTRGARHLVLLHDGQALMILRGEIQHKNLWLVDLKTGAERQLTHFPADFDVRDFDISPDGQEIVLERVEQRSDVVLLDLPRP